MYSQFILTDSSYISRLLPNANFVVHLNHYIFDIIAIAINYKYNTNI